MAPVRPVVQAALTVRRKSCDRHMISAGSRTGLVAKYLKRLIQNHTFNHVVEGSIPSPLTIAKTQATLLPSTMGETSSTPFPRIR